MLNLEFFSNCIRDNLKDRRFGKERADEIITHFEDRAKMHVAGGKNLTDAAAIAMRETFDNITKQATEKAKRTAKQLQVQAQARDVIAKAATVDVSLFGSKDKNGAIGSRGKALAHAVMSMIAPDKRFGSPSYEAKRQIISGQMWSLFGEALEDVRKGAFGVQQGKAHLPNLVREIFGARTGDKAAERLAQAFGRVDDLGVDLFNQAGGSLSKLRNYFPQPARDVTKLIKGGEKQFVDMHLNELDWKRTRWPDGTEITPAQRERYLKEVYATKSSDGANKLDDKSFRGQGKAMGNMLDMHRQMHYKDGDAWLRVHDAYGDGNPFDVIGNHISDTAHHIAAVDTFGPNPDMGYKNMKAVAMKAAYDQKLSRLETKELEAILSDKVDKMFNLNMRKNPMNVEGWVAATTTSVTNFLSGAYLGGASLAAFFGDHATTGRVMRSNNMSGLSGNARYFKAMTYDKAFQRRISAQTGWIHEQSVMHLNGAERFNPLINMGNKASRFVADTVMRASLNTFHTTNARWKVQAEFMGFFHSLKDTEFDKLPIKAVMERYNITAKDWDDLRKNVKPFTPRSDTNFLAPIHVLDTKLKNKQQLFEKFQGMILEESQTAVPNSRTESRVTLKSDSNPNTLVGVLLHSFATFKNFPLTYYTVMGRHAMVQPTAKGRIGFIASMAAATTISGLIAVQMKELTKGREAIPMFDEEGNPNYKLFGKAFVTGGGAGIWGDFLFSGVNAYGQGPQDAVAGPLVDILGDVTQIAFGDIIMDSAKFMVGEETDGKLGEHLVALGRKVQPGQNLWYAELIFQRMFWDSIEDAVDPEAPSKRRRKEGKRKDEYGNDYWWHLGDKTPEFLE